MVTNSPYKLDRVTKPGYGQPVPIKPFSVTEPQEDIERCLDCSVPPEKCYGNCGHGDCPKANWKFSNYSQYRYYMAHREEILAKRRAAHQAKKKKEM